MTKWEPMPLSFRTSSQEPSSFSDRWSTFFENQGVYRKERTDTNIGTGLAFLLTTNLQINASAKRQCWRENTEGFYGSVGVSYRINKTPGYVY